MARRPTVAVVVIQCPVCGRDGADGHTHRDGCVVTAEPFSEVLRAFVTRWNQDRPQPGGQYGLEEEPPIRALAWLAAEATRVAKVADVTEGTLEGLLDHGARAKPLLELRVADALAIALSRPDLLYDPRVVVYRNPQVEKNAYCIDERGDLLPFPPANCCAGSSRRPRAKIAA